MNSKRSASDETTVIATMSWDDWNFMEYMDDETVQCNLDCGSLGEKYNSLNLIDRYRCSVFKIASVIGKLAANVVYDFAPFLVAEEVSPDVLELLPSTVLDYKVKCQVVNGRLLIFDLSTDVPHGTGNFAIAAEVARWSNAHIRAFFGAAIDAKNPRGDGTNGSYAPDCVVFVGPKYKNTNNTKKVVVIELEVSNRNPTGMRRDYAVYFDEDSMICIIGIKLFGKKSVPGQRAAAVMWTLEDDGRVVTKAAFDIGILPLTTSAKNSFAAPGVDMLPPVAVGAWQRFMPVPGEVMDVHGSAKEALLHASSWVVHSEVYDLYPGQEPPILTIDAEQLLTRLEVRGAAPISAEDIGNMTINLRAVFHKVFLAARPFIEQEQQAVGGAAAAGGAPV